MWRGACSRLGMIIVRASLTVLALASLAACAIELGPLAEAEKEGRAPSGDVGVTDGADGGARGARGADVTLDAGAAQPDGATPDSSSPMPPPPPPPLPGTRPSWQSGQGLFAWRAVPGTKLSSAPPSAIVPGNTGPISKVIAWCGMALDTRDSTLYSAANGGHMDYAGNEVNAIRLSNDTPSWTERRAPTPAGQVIFNAGYYADGRPTSRHSYFAEVFVESKGRVMTVGAGSAWGPGDGKSFVDGFDPATNDWDPAGTYPSVPSLQGPSYTVAKDPKTDDVYVVSNYRLMRFRTTMNSRTTLTASFAVYGYETAAAVDTKRNRILFVGGQANGAGYVYPIAGGAGAVANLGITEGALGIAYVPSLDAFLVRSASGGGQVTRIDAGSLQVTSLSTTGGAGIPSSTNGVYTRFAYAPGLGGVVYVPGYDSDVYFLRLE